MEHWPDDAVSIYGLSFVSVHKRHAALPLPPVITHSDLFALLPDIIMQMRWYMLFCEGRRLPDQVERATAEGVAQFESFRSCCMFALPHTGLPE